MRSKGGALKLLQEGLTYRSRLDVEDASWALRSVENHKGSAYVAALFAAMHAFRSTGGRHAKKPHVCAARGGLSFIRVDRTVHVHSEEAGGAGNLCGDTYILRGLRTTSVGS